MVDIIENVARIQAAGTKEKIIEEYFGNVNSKSSQISIAKMKSSPGWEEPGQTPEFDEYTIVLKGILHIKTLEHELDVPAGQAVLAHKNEWIQYSTPSPEGAEYIAICLPAFSPELVHRDRA